jgi:hypothetical protein
MDRNGQGRAQQEKRCRQRRLDRDQRAAGRRGQGQEDEDRGPGDDVTDGGAAARLVQGGRL